MDHRHGPRQPRILAIYDSVLRNWHDWAEERPKLRLLDRDTAVIGGVRFLGATPWTDFDRKNPAALSIGIQCMADFHAIRYRGRRLHPRDTVELHLRDREWLAQQLERPHDGPTVVVTHHLPHLRSIAPQFVGSELNPAFVSDLDEPIRTGRPDVCVVCNPLGYPNEQFVTFDSALVIEV